MAHDFIAHCETVDFEFEYFLNEETVGLCLLTGIIASGLARNLTISTRNWCKAGYVTDS